MRKVLGKKGSKPIVAGKEVPLHQFYDMELKLKIKCTAKEGKQDEFIEIESMTQVLPSHNASNYCFAYTHEAK